MTMIHELRVLVTGGCGFIGSHIVESLLLNGAKFVRVLDNLQTGKIENIQFLLDKYDNLEFIYGDISDLEMCKKAVQNIDVITHQAALCSVPISIDNPLLNNQSNVNGFINILISAKDAGIKRVVYASSSAVYGDDTTLPKIEQKIGKTLSPYAVGKHIDELYAYTFTRCYGMECIGLRYFNIFGPRQDPNGPYAAVISKFISIMKESKQPVINGDGTFSRDFTYVDNVVQANILGLTTDNTESFGEVFNIGTGKETTILELIDTLNEILGVSIKPIFGDERAGDINFSKADISKAQSILKFNPSVSFKEGLEKMNIN